MAEAVTPRTSTTFGLFGSTNRATLSTSGVARRPWLNWLLAVLTIPVAMFVTLCAFGAVMGLARCADYPCRHYGPTAFWFGVTAYGPLVAAGLAIALSFFTATRKHGIWVPLGVHALLLTDLAVLLFTFRP
ncbi:membrane glycosyltransferase [Mycobacterium sp. MAA66]